MGRVNTLKPEISKQQQTQCYSFTVIKHAIFFLDNYFSLIQRITRHMVLIITTAI